MYRLHTTTTDDFNDVGEGHRVNGDLWFRTDLNEIRGFLNGNIYTLFENTGRIPPIAMPPTTKFTGTLTRAASAASGSAAVTGLGFRPSIIHLIAADDALPGNTSMGWSDGTMHVATSNIAASFATCVEVVAAGNGHTATVTMDNDGFTVAWTKVGQGLNLTVKYLAIK